MNAKEFLEQQQQRRERDRQNCLNNFKAEIDSTLRLHILADRSYPLFLSFKHNNYVCKRYTKRTWKTLWCKISYDDLNDECRTYLESTGFKYHLRHLYSSKGYWLDLYPMTNNENT